MTGRQQLPRIGVSACVFRQDKVLLIQRARPPMAGLWSLPGGHVEPGERVLAAAQRELREETGVEADLAELAGLYDVIERAADGSLSHHYVIACYAGHWRQGEAAAASDALAVRWAGFAELPAIRLTPSVMDAVSRARRLLML